MADSSTPGDDRAFLGRGWSFPPTFDPPTFERKARRVQMLEHEADIVSSLHILLSTARGERIMVPQYGCNMDELVFENLDTRMRTLMADKIESAILYHEPRIDLERVQVDDDPDAELEGRVLIGVIYRVKETNSRFNFVFPYYRDEGTDINLTTTVQLLPDEP
jgi:phage baseplate assembly protein W